MIKHFKSEDIDNALSLNGHQYVVGNLARPQIFEHLHDENVNVGIGVHNEFDWEEPHYHTISNEYQYVIDGEAKYVDIDNNIEYHVKKGDFFVVTKGTKYMLKAQKGAKILFFKYPAVNDKILIELTKDMFRWVVNWETPWKDSL